MPGDDSKHPGRLAPEKGSESWYFPWQSTSTGALGSTSPRGTRGNADESLSIDQVCSSSTGQSGPTRLQRKDDMMQSSEERYKILSKLQHFPEPTAPTLSGKALRDRTPSPLSLSTILSTETEPLPPQGCDAVPEEPAPSSNAPGTGTPESASVPGEERFIKGFPLICLTVGLMLAVFLISLDRTIISTVR